MAEPSMTSRLLGKPMGRKAPGRDDDDDDDDGRPPMLPLPGLSGLPTVTEASESRPSSRHNSSGSFGCADGDFGFSDDDDDGVGIDGELPEGWKHVESRSVPGEMVYENVHTSERQAWKPDDAAPTTESNLSAILDPDKVTKPFPKLDPKNAAAAFIQRRSVSQGEGGSVGRTWTKQWKDEGADPYGTLRRGKSADNILRLPGHAAPTIVFGSPKGSPRSWRATLRKKLGSPTATHLPTPGGGSPSPIKPGSKPKACCAVIPPGMSACPTCGRAW